MESPSYLDPARPVFPDPQLAPEELGGLVAVGGNLATGTLYTAYRRGIFPWFEDGQPLLWWSPPQRAVILPGGLRLSRSLKKSIRRDAWEMTCDRDFRQVIARCAGARKGASGTWITADMVDAYTRLHREGHAHSLEVWRDGQLVGGLYGLAVGSLFCGESMFSLAPNASKVALACLCQTLFSHGFTLIDCQLENPHLTAMGAVTVARDWFLERLAVGRDHPAAWPSQWKLASL